MKKLFTGFALVAVVGILFSSLPSSASAQSDRSRPDSAAGRIDARLMSVTERLCDQLSMLIQRGLPITLPGVCNPVPPPIDMCPNVPGTQQMTEGQCADIECVEDGGSWNGSSCVMPPPPIDVCPNIPGDQATGPCADIECAVNGGTWDGEDCVMPPPPPIDICLNVPGVQEESPCLDVVCVEVGGMWNGSSCDMPPPPEEGGVFINEIAWMGSMVDGASNTNAEWVELRNTGTEAVDLIGWAIIAMDGAPNIQVVNACTNTIIQPGGFYLFARTSSVYGVSADCTYSSPMSNDGEFLTLFDPEGTAIDAVDGGNGWAIGGTPQKGNNGTKDTAQRSNTGEWFTASPTPRAENAPNASEN